jgi:hypothetical protein
LVRKEKKEEELRKLTVTLRQHKRENIQIIGFRKDFRIPKE